MATSTVAGPPRPVPAEERDPLVRRAAVVTLCAAVLWVALMNQWFLAQHLLGHVPAAASPVRLSIDSVGFDADVLPYDPTDEDLEGAGFSLSRELERMRAGRT